MPRRNNRKNMDMKKEMMCGPKKGEVWLADLGTRGGHIQEGVRPVLVMNAWNGSSSGGVCTVLPITRSHKRPWMQTHVVVAKQDLYACKGWFDEGLVLAEQMTSVDGEGFIRYIGSLPAGGTKMQEVEEAIRARMGI